MYEQFFFLKYHGGWSFTEAYNLPVQLRNWFLERLVKQMKSEQESVERAKSGKRKGNTQTLTPYNNPAPKSFTTNKTG
tara:strand:+ start:17940 stop:18173 length:234 start_codon:yes stop_codon:yes gene_type:complete